MRGKIPSPNRVSEPRSQAATPAAPSAPNATGSRDLSPTMHCDNGQFRRTAVAAARKCRGYIRRYRLRVARKPPAFRASCRQCNCRETEFVERPSSFEVKRHFKKSKHGLVE